MPILATPRAVASDRHTADTGEPARVLPTPPGWDLFSTAVRRAYVDELAAAGVLTGWPTGDR